MPHVNRINRAIDFITQQPCDELTLEQLAEISCYSKFHFLREFHRLMGETPFAFIQRTRLERAARQLVYVRNNSITEYAYENGFSSPQAFSKCFRRHFGTTPSDYQSTNRFRVVDNQSDIELNYQGLNVLQNHWADAPNRIKVTNLPAQRVAYIRNLGTYGENEGIRRSYRALMSWGQQKGLGEYLQTRFGICWDNPKITQTEFCRYDACLPVPEAVEPDALVSIQTIPSGLYATWHVHVLRHEIRSAWAHFLEIWLPYSGYKMELGTRYEIYRGMRRTYFDKPVETTLCLPVRRIT